MSEPTCCVTGQIAGHPDACGDCDPCGAYRRVSPEVQRLIAESQEWRDKFGERAAECDRLRAEVERLRGVEAGVEIAVREFKSWAADAGSTKTPRGRTMNAVVQRLSDALKGKGKIGRAARAALGEGQ